MNAIILQEDKILLGKRSRKLSEGGKWSLPGGFMDRDETLEQAIKREVKEETGWDIKNIQLLRYVDNPNRRNEDNQNVAFVYLVEGVAKTGDLDWETDETNWFEVDNLPSQEEIAFDHLSHIEYYLQTKHNKS